MPQCSRRGMLQPAPHSLSIVKRKRGHLCALACSELLACFQEVDSLVCGLLLANLGGNTFPRNTRMRTAQRKKKILSIPFPIHSRENLLTRPSLGAKFGGLRAPRGWTS